MTNKLSEEDRRRVLAKKTMLVYGCFGQSEVASVGEKRVKLNPITTGTRIFS